MRRIYIDANGSSPAITEAKQKLLDSIDLIGNPSSSHEHGRRLRAMLDEARHHVAKAINAQEKEVIFTSGASEANRLFVDALLNKGSREGKKYNILMSPFEHPSLLKPVIKAAEQGYFTLNIMDLDSHGALRPIPDYVKTCDVLIACQAHNETGIVPDLCDLLSNVKPHTIVMSDISQSFCRLDKPKERVDVLTFSSQKMGGFAGAGGAVFRGNAQTLPSPWLGGGQERGFRPGTESSLLIFAFGEAARHVEVMRKAHQELGALRDYFEEMLMSTCEVKIIGKYLPRLSNTSAVCFFKEDPDALRIACDLAGLSVGFGAACSGLAPERSFALKKLQISLVEEKTCVRFSFPPFASRADADETLERLLKNVLVHTMAKFRVCYIPLAIVPGR